MRYPVATILYCDAETIMRRSNNVEVSQCVLFDREKTIGNCFLQGKQKSIYLICFNSCGNQD